LTKYCTNCGARLIGNIKFCGRCGKPCVPQRPPTQMSEVIHHKKSSGGIWKFFAGTAVGAFFMSLFGGSSASTSNSTHTETVESFHDTIVYERDNDYDEYDTYENDCACDDDLDDDCCDDGEYDDCDYDE